MMLLFFHTYPFKKYLGDFFITDYGLVSDQGPSKNYKWSEVKRIYREDDTIKIDVGKKVVDDEFSSEKGRHSFSLSKTKNI